MSKRKKISAAKRSAKRARVQVNRSDGERDLVSEPEEGMSFFVPYFSANTLLVKHFFYKPRVMIMQGMLAACGNVFQDDDCE